MSEWETVESIFVACLLSFRREHLREIEMAWSEPTQTKSAALLMGMNLIKIYVTRRHCRSSRFDCEKHFKRLLGILDEACQTAVEMSHTRPGMCHTHFLTS